MYAWGKGAHVYTLKPEDSLGQPSSGSGNHVFIFLFVYLFVLGGAERESLTALVFFLSGKRASHEPQGSTISIFSQL